MQPHRCSPARQVGYPCRQTNQSVDQRYGLPRRRTKKRLREPVNGLTHLAGGLLACVGLLVLLARVTGRTDQIVAFGIFGLSLVALYSASTLYHLLPLSPAGVARLRR